MNNISDIVDNTIVNQFAKFNHIEDTPKEYRCKFDLTLLKLCPCLTIGNIYSLEEIVKQLKIPILQIHGDEDKIVLPYAGEYTINQIKHSNKQLKMYNGVGHSPFLESPDLFNDDLSNFANRV